MKKLMIAASLICAAVVSQAATTHWQFTDGATVLKDGYGKDGKSYTPVAMQNTTVYLLAIVGNNYTTQNAIYQDLLSGAKSAADVKAMALQTGTTDSLGKITTPVAFDREDAVTGTTYYYALVAFSSDDKYVYFSGAASGGAQDHPAVTSLSMSVGNSSTFKDSDTVSAGGWYAAAVPEPTSGLLLILGVAGLARKRRRA